MKRPVVVVLLPLLLYGAFSTHLKLGLMEVRESSGTLEAGAEAPTFVLERLNGGEVDLSSAARDNRMVVVNFWATWCGPCKLEMPQFQSLYEQYAETGFEILAITTEERAVVESFLRTKDYTFPILLDPGGEVTGGFGVEAFPTTVLVDSEGRVIRSWKGIEPRLEREITRVLGNRQRGTQGEGETPPSVDTGGSPPAPNTGGQRPGPSQGGPHG